MHIESQAERNQSSFEKRILIVQADLIKEFCGKEEIKSERRKKESEWVKKNSALFRKIIEENPRLAWEYPESKREIKDLLCGETIH